MKKPRFANCLPTKKEQVKSSIRMGNDKVEWLSTTKQSYVEPHPTEQIKYVKKNMQQSQVQFGKERILQTSQQIYFADPATVPVKATLTQKARTKQELVNCQIKLGNHQIDYISAAHSQFMNPKEVSSLDKQVINSLASRRNKQPRYDIVTWHIRRREAPVFEFYEQDQVKNRKSVNRPPIVKYNIITGN